MSSSNSMGSKAASQWADVKVSGGNKTDLAKTVAQIRLKVKSEREIFSVSSSSLSSTNKPTSK